MSVGERKPSCPLISNTDGREGRLGIMKMVLILVFSLLISFDGHFIQQWFRFSVCTMNGVGGGGRDDRRDKKYLPSQLLRLWRRATLIYEWPLSSGRTLENANNNLVGRKGTTQSYCLSFSISSVTGTVPHRRRKLVFPASVGNLANQKSHFFCPDRLRPPCAYWGRAGGPTVHSIAGLWATGKWWLCMHCQF